MFFEFSKSKELLNKKNSSFDLVDLERKYEQLYENVKYGQKLSKTGSWTLDNKTGEMFVTNEIYEIFGCNSTELGCNQDSFYSFVHHEDQEKVRMAVEGALDGSGYDIEYRIITPDKQVKYVNQKTTVIIDEQNNTMKTIGIIQDITEQKLLENNLKEIGDNLSLAQRVAGVGCWKYDIINDKYFGSEEMYRIYGINPSEFDDDFRNTLKLVHPEDRYKIEEALGKHLAGESCTIEFRIPQKDGSLKYVIGKGEPIFGKEGQVTGIIGTLQDVTEKKMMEEKISKIQKIFKVLVQKSSDVFEIIDPDGTIRYISDASYRVIGYKPEERIGRKVYDFYQGEMLEKVKNVVKLCIENPDKEIKEDVVLTSKDGQDIYLEVYMQNLLHDPSVEGIVINLRDNTKRIIMEKKMAYISTHDELTDLPNRRYFDKQLKVQCKYAKETETRFAVMMLDIDGLKNINYSLGYDLGDKLILEIVQKLRTCLDEKIFLSRYSDDHFAIIIQGNKTKNEYDEIAKNIINIFKKSVKVQNYDLDVFANIGISIFPNDSNNMYSLKKYAKVALLRAKKERRNTYKFYSSDLDIINYKESVLRSDLHHAIEKNQLRVYYQPIVNIKSNEILAAEALIRWEHPEWGLVKPNEFIPIAEETGLVIDLGKWVLREVCRNYKQWMTKGLPDIKVSVNFSAIQFMENDFANQIKNIIDEYELDYSFLIVEITENILIKNVDKVKADIQKLQSLGMQVALDDFGTGFSSLAYLNSFNLDIIKLDGSFIKDTSSENKGTAIARAVITTAQELKIKLVAECIENVEQLSFLKSLNCYAGQGYLFSKPTSAEDFMVLLAKKRCKPIFVDSSSMMPKVDRRKYFRIKFTQFLEADLTIKELEGRKINVGYTKVLIKNIGPGGLCFVSNIRFPHEKGFVLQFITQLIGEEIRVCGNIVWANETDNDLYEYGVEFLIDENERMRVIRVLNQVQIRMRNNLLFADGSFASVSPNVYYKKLTQEL